MLILPRFYRNRICERSHDGTFSYRPNAFGDLAHLTETCQIAERADAKSERPLRRAMALPMPRPIMLPIKASLGV